MSEPRSVWALAAATVACLVAHPLAWAQQAEHTLVALAAAALEGYAGIIAAEHEREAAHALADVRFGELLPNVSVEGLVGRQHLSAGGLSGRSGSSDLESYEVNLAQPLLASSSLLGYRSAQRGAAAADASYRSARQQLVAEVALAFVAWHATADQLDLLQKRKGRVQAQLEASRQLAAERIGSEADVILVKARLGEIDALIEAARLEVGQAAAALARLTGHHPRSLPALDSDFLPPEVGGVEPRIAAALQDNPEIVAAVEKVEEARLVRDAARAAHYPRLDLSVRKTFGASSDSTFYGLQLQVPVFSGFRISRQADRAELSYLATESRLSELYARVTETVRAQHAAASAQARNAETARANVSLRQEYLEKVTQAWLEGFTSTTEVLDAQEGLFNAQVELRNALYGYFSALVRLRAAEGSLNIESVRDISDKFHA